MEDWLALRHTAACAWAGCCASAGCVPHLCYRWRVACGIVLGRQGGERRVARKCGEGRERVQVRVRAAGKRWSRSAGRGSVVDICWQQRGESQPVHYMCNDVEPACQALTLRTSSCWSSRRQSKQSNDRRITARRHIVASAETATTMATRWTRRQDSMEVAKSTYPTLIAARCARCSR